MKSNFAVAKHLKKKGFPVQATDARNLKVIASVLTPEALATMEAFLDEHHYECVSRKPDLMLYKKKSMPKKNRESAEERIGFAVLFYVVKNRLPDLNEQEIGAIIDFGPSPTAGWKRGRYMPPGLLRLKRLGDAAGLSLDEIHSILNGGVPEEVIEIARLIGTRVRSK